MSKHQKSWSVQEKQEVVEFYRQHSISEAVRKYGVSNVSIYKWEKVIEESGISGFTEKAITKSNSEFNKLKRENDRLMRLVAEKEVIISIQNDLLKKKEVSKDDRIEIALKYIDSILPMVEILEVLGLPKSTFYYKPIQNSGKQKGRTLSNFTKTTDGQLVANQKVINAIKELLAQEFVDYGYLKVTHYLRQELNYIINPKKVYNIMKMNNLLNVQPVHSSKTKREWVKDIVPKPDLDFSYLEFDIKYFYVHKKRRNALVLTVIDVKSRWVLGQFTAWKINEKHVKELFEEIFSQYELPEKIYVRNDNGSQFVAHTIQKYFIDKKNPIVVQEFTKPATPEQNAHIESYHSITERVICQRYQFDDLKELKDTLERFRYFYNFKRIHSGIEYKSPFKYLLQKGIDMSIDPSEKSYNCILKAS